MQLNYKVMGSGQPLIILHGLMGMLDNWLKPAKILSEKYTVYLVDQRNHGKSFHADSHTYQDMMEDLEDFVDQLFLTDFILLGHSMGGKTAMKFAQNHPQLLDKLVVADIGPKKYPVHHKGIIDCLNSVDFSKVSSRGEVDDILSRGIKEEDVRMFLSKNLYWKEKGLLAWRFNLGQISKDLENVSEAIEDRLYDGDTLFIRGLDSNYIEDNDIPNIKTIFPNAQFFDMPNTGHWVHAQNTELFLEGLIRFLEK